MSTAEITGSGNRSPRDLAHPQRGVMVVYEGRREGGAALRYARALAGQVGVPLTVLCIASKERTDIGCGSCRQGAAFRKELACECATADLTEARDLIESWEPTDVAVDFALARGSFVRAVLTAVGDHGADVIVLPAPRRSRLRRAVSRDRVQMLRGRTSASVIAAPERSGAPSAPTLVRIRSTSA
jgi:nucleotide-binding universal stress UspA family protein